MSSVQFCTAASRAQLSSVRVLAESLARAHPNAFLWVLLVDDATDEDTRSLPSSCRALRLDEIGLAPREAHQLVLLHGVDLPQAIVPFVIDEALRRSGAPVIALDPSVVVFGDLSEIAIAADRVGVAVTPHALQPYPDDGRQPDDTTILSAGIYNLGVVGFGKRGVPVLRFLESRAELMSASDDRWPRFSLGRWLDLAASYFPLHVVRDLGVNVAYWNLHERPLSERGGSLYAGGSPLRAFNFAGYDVAQPDLVSRHVSLRPRVELRGSPVIAQLCDEYRSALLRHGAATSPSCDDPRLSGGIPVDEQLRRLYSSAVAEWKTGRGSLPPDALDPAEYEAFLHWAQQAYGLAGLAVPSWASPIPPLSALWAELTASS